MEKKKNNTIRSLAAIAAVFVLVIAGIFLAGRFQGGNTSALAAVVSLDVNPGIELNVDKNEKVISVSAVNDDGREVLSGMELDGTSFDVAVNAIIGSMLQHGYLDDTANSILLSVSGVDGYDATKLQAKLTDNVSQLLKDCSVLSQNVSDADSKLVDKANKYGITVGKARLIEEIISSNSRHNFEELVGLTINELNLIADGQQLPGISTQGQASDKSYIGNDAALSAALTHAGLSSNDVREVEVDLDYEYGMMVYEVEFECGSVDYEYGIAATDGSVIWVEDDEGYRVRSGRPDYMYANTAKRAALSHAGLTEDQVSLLRTELDHDDGIHVYEVKFKYGDYEYEYKVDGGSGTVIDFEKELHH